MCSLTNAVLYPNLSNNTIVNAIFHRQQFASKLLRNFDIYDKQNRHNRNRKLDIIAEHRAELEFGILCMMPDSVKITVL